MQRPGQTFSHLADAFVRSPAVSRDSAAAIWLMAFSTEEVASVRRDLFLPNFKLIPFVQVVANSHDNIYISSCHTLATNQTRLELS